MPPKRGTKRAAESKGKKKKSGKKKAYVPSYVQEGEKCVVCGDSSTGTHYRAMTCEGCKGFFRRTIQKSNGQEPKLVCKRNRNCTITSQTRNTCQYCRYRKCIAGKMDPNSVLSDEERRRLRKLISTNRHERRIKEGQALTKDEWDILTKLGKSYKDVKVSELFTFIEKEEYVKEFESPDVLEVNTPEVNADVQPNDKTIMSSSLIHVIKFIWSIPGIQNVSEEDLMKLFYSHLLDIVGFLLAELFDIEENELCFRNFRLKESDLDKYSYMKEIFNFAKYYSQFVTNDGIILGCLCAIRFLSVDNIALHYGITVENILETLHEIFVKYLVQEKVASMRDVFRCLANFENIRDYHSKLLTKLALVDSFQPNYSELFHLSKDILDKDPDLNSSPELPPQPEINPSSKTQGESRFDSIELKCPEEGDSCFNLQTTTNDKVEKISCMSTSLDLSSPTLRPSDVYSSPELPPQPEINPSSKTQGESRFDSIELKCREEGDSCFNLQKTNDEVKKIPYMSTSLDLSCPTLRSSDVCSSPDLPPAPLYCSLIPPQYPSTPGLPPYALLVPLAPVISLNHGSYSPSTCSQPLFQPYSIRVLSPYNADEFLRGQRPCHSETAALYERPENLSFRPFNFASDTLGSDLTFHDNGTLRQDYPPMSFSNHLHAPSNTFSSTWDVKYDNDERLLDMTIPKKSNLQVTVAQDSIYTPTLTMAEPIHEAPSITQGNYRTCLKDKENDESVTSAYKNSNMVRQNDMSLPINQLSSNSISTNKNDLNSSNQCTSNAAGSDVEIVNLNQSESAPDNTNLDSNKTPAKGLKKLWIDHYSQSSSTKT